MTNQKSEDYLNTSLAPLYRDISGKSLGMIDDELVMVAGTMRDLERLKDKTWDRVVGELMNNPLLSVALTI